MEGESWDRLAGNRGPVPNRVADSTTVTSAQIELRDARLARAKSANDTSAAFSETEQETGNRKRLKLFDLEFVPAPN